MKKRGLSPPEALAVAEDGGPLEVMLLTLLLLLFY